MAGQRPIGVTIVAVLAWISGFFSILGGVLVIISGLEVESASRGLLITGAVISIVIGIAVIVVSLGLLRGNNTARIITTIVFVLNIVNAVFQMFGGQQSLWTAILSALPSIIGIVLLYTKPAQAFFGTGQPVARA
jgi:hypothetical protein